MAPAGDVNGDGLADWLVAAPFADGPAGRAIGRVELFLGVEDGVSAEPALVLFGPATAARFGESVAGAGDVNGDGFDDVLIGASRLSEGGRDAGAAFLYQGGPQGLGSAPAWTLLGEERELLGSSVAAVGDVNNDGLADVALGSPGWRDVFSLEGRVRVFAGSREGLGATAIWQRTGGESGLRLGELPAVAGDVNGDGISDLLIGSFRADGQSTEEGRVELFFGSDQGLSLLADDSLAGSAQRERFGRLFTLPGDINGDGYADAWIATQATVLLYAGSPEGLEVVPGGVLERRPLSLAGGDLNGDGLADGVLGEPFEGNLELREGRASVFLGSQLGFGRRAAWTVESHVRDSTFGETLAVIGDTDGDGFGELLVGSPRYDGAEQDSGRAWLYFGAANKANPRALCPPATLWRCECDGIGGVDGPLASASRHPFGEAVRLTWRSESCTFADPHAPVTDASCPVYGNNTVELFVESGDLDAECSFPVTVLDDLAPVSDMPFSSTAMEIGDRFDEPRFWSLALAGDVNADGYDDVLVGRPYAAEGDGRVELWAGGPNGLGLSWSLERPDPDHRAGVGHSVAAAGDVNGDGIDDFLIGIRDAKTARVGRAELFYGSREGPVGPVWQFDGPTTTVTVAGADANGDGFSDVIVGFPVFTGQVLWFPGGPSGPSSEPEWIVHGEPGGFLPPFFGDSIDNLGDLNADGYDDIGVGSFGYAARALAEGRAYAYLGSADGPGGVADWTADGTLIDEWFGRSVSGAGDVDGDGDTEILVGAPFFYGSTEPVLDYGKAVLFSGGAGGPSINPAWERLSEGLGRQVDAAGDVDADGYDDVVILGPLRVEVFSGSATGLSQTAAWALGEGGLYRGVEFHRVAAGGDINGDGHADIVLLGQRDTATGETAVLAVFSGQDGEPVPGGRRIRGGPGS